MTGKTLLNAAIDKLGTEFARRDWKYLDVPPGDAWEKTWRWPGPEDEEIMICVHKGTSIHELFHRQDFFFLNFAYQGSYGAFSYRFDNHITVHENECYIGQPYAGYALHKESDEEFIIFGILIQKETFFRTFLPVLSSSNKLFHFFLDPQTNEFSDEYIRLRFERDSPVRTLLELMVLEYADKGNGTQDILSPMVLALLMYVARQYKLENTLPEAGRLSDQIVRYMGEHTEVVTLKEIAAHFSYHPNYISALLRRELGKTFSELLMQQRMERAAALLRGTNLPIEDIAAMLGYGSSSNFYKTFREYYGMSPREFVTVGMRCEK